MKRVTKPDHNALEVLHRLSDQKPAMVEALHILAGAGAEIVIISDANTIYIEELLEV